MIYNKSFNGCCIVDTSFMEGCNEDQKYAIVRNFDSDDVIFASSFAEALAILNDLNEEESEVNR